MPLLSSHSFASWYADDREIPNLIAARSTLQNAGLASSTAGSTTFLHRRLPAEGSASTTLDRSPADSLHEAPAALSTEISPVLCVSNGTLAFVVLCTSMRDRANPSTANLLAAPEVPGALR